MMSELRPKELIRAEELVNNGKVEEALEIIINFEKRREITQKEFLWTLLFKGQAYMLLSQYERAVEIGEHAYHLSKELGLIIESAEALLIHAHGISPKNPDKGLELILQAEEIFNSLPNASLNNYPSSKESINLRILSAKSWNKFFKGDFNTALELTLKGLEIAEKIDVKVATAYLIFLTSMIERQKGELDKALGHATRSLKLMEEMGFQVGLADSLYGIGFIYFSKGNLISAQKFCKKCLSIKKVTNDTKVNAFTILGAIYKFKGELNKALKNYKKAIEISGESQNYMKAQTLMGIGSLYKAKGEDKQARHYLLKSLKLSEKLGDLNIPQMVYPLFYLFLLNLDLDSPKQALQYLNRLKTLSEQNESEVISQGYKLAKAAFLKSSGRRRNSTEAELLLKQLVEENNVYPIFYVRSLIFLCEILIEEFSIYDNPEVLDEINPLIMKLIQIAKDQNSFSWLAEAKLIQAKTALIH
jgi:tetratricopeptide (TPR) repeat protein